MDLLKTIWNALDMAFCLGCRYCAYYWEKMPIVIVLVVVILTNFIMSTREVQGFKYLCKTMNILIGNGGVNEEL